MRQRSHGVEGSLYFYFFCYFLFNHSMTSILSFVLVTAWLEIFFVVQLGTRWVSLSKIEGIIISWIERGLWRQSNFFWTSWYNCNGDVCQFRELPFFWTAGSILKGNVSPILFCFLQSKCVTGGNQVIMWKTWHALILQLRLVHFSALYFKARVLVFLFEMTTSCFKNLIVCSFTPSAGCL